MTSTNSRSQLLDETAVASLLSLSVRTLQSWRVSGGGPPFFKIGRAVRYNINDIEDWVARRARASTSDDGEDRT